MPHSKPYEDAPLGVGLPPFTPHAVSVSLPKWKDNVEYEQNNPRVLNAMVAGYPRFFIALNIRKLMAFCEQKFGARGEQCILLPTQKTGDECRSFIERRSALAGTLTQARVVHLHIAPDEDNESVAEAVVTGSSTADLFIVLFPSEHLSLAKEFWQHTGMGISSRMAEHCLSLLSSNSSKPASPTATKFAGKIPNKHYAKRSSLASPPPAAEPGIPAESFTPAHDVYLEERYGRNLPISLSTNAKKALRRRIAGVLGSESSPDSPTFATRSAEGKPSVRGVPEISEDDVYLYPGGMAAIWSAHHFITAVRPEGKSVCFGFPYVDTLKILQKWGPGCHFFGQGLDSDIDNLEVLLSEEHQREPSRPPVLALFTEFPSNPLLRSADLARLRGLADKYDFLIVIDETVGNFMNVDVVGYADILVSSLTKVFSGSSNVMGGSLIVNPRGRHYVPLKRAFDAAYEDLYFDHDAIFMERNSRDFQSRTNTIDSNTEVICDYLLAQSQAGGKTSGAIKNVYYPKFTTRENYDKCRVKGDSTRSAGGYGGLFSVVFTSEATAAAFYDSLPCYKGPSLGTNFTLACPFTILAHYNELEWAAEQGVDANLVRVSIGLEDVLELKEFIENAVRAAEAVL